MRFAAADYGLEGVDEDEVPTAPKFTLQPEDTVYEATSQIDDVSLECIADGYPTPTYKWFKFRAGDSIEIDPENERSVTASALTVVLPSCGSAISLKLRPVHVPP